MKIMRWFLPVLFLMGCHSNLNIAQRCTIGKIIPEDLKENAEYAEANERFVKYRLDCATFTGGVTYFIYTEHDTVKSIWRWP